MSKKTTKRPKIDPSNAEAMIRQAIIDSGRSVNEIAQASDVSQSSLSRFMREERTLTLPAASRLFSALGLEVSKAKTKGDSK